ncbi:MAG: class I SAM-dependent methyltransferase [Bacteroidetes bacterium]|nr:class I SAM-dependent methyltransferase [Bacteroidota bacterium]
MISKHAKYNTLNPISKKLLANFFSAIEQFYSKIEAEIVLDIGCGEGMLLNVLEPYAKEQKCFAIDIDPKEVRDAKKNIPFCTVSVGNAYKIPFENNFADIVICSEVLEHLESPEDALNEIHRVSNRYAILTVPNEPLWSFLNMVRLKYWNEFGNTPGHINRWTPQEFKDIVREKFNIIGVQYPTPWTVLLCEKKFNYEKIKYISNTDLLE